MFFKNKEEIFLYKEPTDCAAMMKELLSLSTAEAGKIRQQARSASIERGYQYKDRAESALEVIKSLLN